MEELEEQAPIPPTTNRKLAAIMFADMMGYTALMQEDERKANHLRHRMRTVLEKKIPEFHGKLVQFYGDGALSVFNSALDSAKCAIAIQQELQREPRVSVRVGLHSGDIYYDEHNVYGDCVNLTSRIEALAIPGAVLISDKMYDEIKNQDEVHTQSLGKFNLKNVKRPVEIYALTNEGLAVPTIAQLGIKAGSDKSIAVMPFINMSADPENEYFSDGIAEEILNALTRVDGLQVCSRSSSFTFKGQKKDAREIGRELSVSTLLEGSVRRAGNKVRISAQLTNTVDGYQIWSEVYDGDLDDIFKVQDEISAKIVIRLRENLSQQEKREPIIKPPTENLDAYHLYLKGRYHWNKSNPEEIKKAIASFEEAVQLDPKFAEPYCVLSFCYSFLGSSGLLPRQEAFDKAKDCTLKAIELDPQHPESHLAMATIKFFQNWDFKGAYASIKKAVQLGLSSSLLHQMHSMILIAMGQFDEAIEEMTKALKQDPLSLPLMSYLADAYGFASRFEEAIAQYDRILELDPNFRRAYEGKGFAYIGKRQYDKAIENLEKYQSLIGHPLKGQSALGHAYALGGRMENARESLAKVLQRQKEEPHVNLDLDLAVIYMGLKEYDKAFEHLDRMYAQRMGVACTGIIYCIRYPILLEDFRADPRFDALVEKVGLD